MPAADVLETISQLQARVAELTRDLSEALQQQTATSEVLKVISRSAFDLPTVLHALISSAATLCNCRYGGIYLRESDRLRLGTTIGALSEESEEVMNLPPALDRKTIAGRVALSGRIEHIPDVDEDMDYDFPAVRHYTDTRALMGVPLLRDGKVEGVFYLGKPEPGAFTSRQGELAQTFADQAVIAIENARLFDELKARTAELTEALAQQTASADVLKVISRSVGETEPVFEAILESAAHLCEASFANLALCEHDGLRHAASFGRTPEWDEYRLRHSALRPLPSSAIGRVLATGLPVHVHDGLNDQAYRDGDPGRVGVVELLGARTILSVPMLKDSAVVGVITIHRREVRDFSDKQIALVANFASQAVIAIENARLFQEVQARNREVTEALEQQTATGTILRVIASSPTDIQPVLNAVAETAGRLCDAFDATIYLRRDDRLAVGAHHGPIPVDETGFPIVRDIVTGRAVLDGAPIHVHDLTLAGEEFATGRMMARRLGFRTILATPLLRERQAIGALMIRRTEARPFGDKQIELLKTFADQAVIAIENARLFSELEVRNREVSEALEQQTATADVLDVISRSVGKTEPVFEAIIQSAARLCEASFAHLALCEGDGLRHAAIYGGTPEWEAYRQKHPILRPLPSSAIGHVLATKMPVHVDDAIEDQAFRDGDLGRLSVVNLLGARTILSVPLLKDGDVVGVITIHRQEVRPFTEKQIALVANFASQAVIAIENARLLAELEARSREILSRYFSPNLADRLAATGVDEIELSGQRREVAVLFSDIEGFTSLVETMEPGTLGELLNGYLAGTTSVVFSHEGTVAKIIGDALHVLFGAPGDQPDHAARAVACALDLDAFAQSFRETWRDKGIALGATRIGVNAGPAIVGNFGGGRFFDYTAYGDTINIAARLEAANKQLGTRICVSESVARQVPDFRGRPVGDLVLRGRKEPLRAFEPLRPEQYDDASMEEYLKAFAMLESVDPGALGAFATEVGKQPDDRLASFHLKRLLNGATGTRINMD